MIQLKSK